MKTISIIIPAYNADKYIGKCLESFLSQTFTDAQLIIVNDCSTDNTLQIINEYKTRLEKCGYEVIVLQPFFNVGVSDAINFGLQYVNSNYFMWLDSDDVLKPECFKEKIMFMHDNPEIDLCICKCDTIKYPNYEKIIGIFERENKDRDYFEDVIKMKDCIFVPGSFLVKTSFLLERIPSKTIFSYKRRGQNAQLMLPLLYRSNYKYLDKILYTVVNHDDSMSRSLSRRNYKDIIEYYHDVYITQCETINRIPNMDDYDKNKYKGISLETNLTISFNLSFKNMDYKRARYYYGLMNKENKKKNRQKYLISLPGFHKTKIMLFKIIKKTKRLINK